jgi:hypothetical protein
MQASNCMAAGYQRKQAARMEEGYGGYVIF